MTERFAHDDAAEDPRGNVPSDPAAEEAEAGLREQDILYTIENVPHEEWSDEVALVALKRFLAATEYLAWHDDCPLEDHTICFYRS